MNTLVCKASCFSIQNREKLFQALAELEKSAGVYLEKGKAVRLPETIRARVEEN